MENKKRLIDADRLKSYLWALFKFFGSYPCSEADKITQRTIKRCITEIDRMPTVETVDVDKALEWLEGYTITDTEKVYTNGTVMVPLFRVEQALKDKAYNGLREG